MADEEKGQKGGERSETEFVTLKIPESCGGANQVTQFPASDFMLIHEYLLTLGHEYLSTGTSEQQAAIERWIGLTPNRVESGEAVEASS